MTLREYTDNLVRVLAEKPELEKATVVYSSDEEGNSFHRVFFAPTVGCLNEDMDFVHDEGVISERDFVVNAVCVN